MKRYLAIIDMQKDFIDGSLGSDRAQAIVPDVVRRIQDAKRNGETVLFTMDTHTSDYAQSLEGQRLPIAHCIANTPGWALDHRIEEVMDTGMLVFEKPTFGSVELGEWLLKAAANDPDVEIEFCGLDTDICVIANMLLVKSFLPEAKLAILANLCAGSTPEAHETALAIVKSCLMDVII